MDNITNLGSLSRLHSEYVKKYGKLPDTYEQAVQFAYEQAKRDFADALKEVISNHDYTLVSQMNTVDRGMFSTGIYQAIDELVGEANID